MDALNTKIKSIKTEKTLKVRPENIKSGVSIFGITGTFEGNSDYAKFVEQDRSDNNLICYIYKPTLQDGALEDIEDIFENDNNIIATLLDIAESDFSSIESTLQSADVDILQDIINLCDMTYELFLFREGEYYDVARLHIESSSSESADIFNSTADYGMYGVGFSIETDAGTGQSTIVVGEPYEFIDTSGTDATASDILDGKTAYVNGEYIEGTLVPSGGGKNVQFTNLAHVTTYTAYTKGLSLTITKTGTYKITTHFRRGAQSGTWGSAIYINNTLYGDYNTTWGMEYYLDLETSTRTSADWQKNVIEHVSLQQGDVVSTYGRSNSNGNWLYHLYMLIEEE